MNKTIVSRLSAFEENEMLGHFFHSLTLERENRGDEPPLVMPSDSGFLEAKFFHFEV